MDYTNSAYTKYIVHGLALRMEGVEKEIEGLQTTIRKIIDKIDTEASKRMVAVPEVTFNTTHTLPPGFSSAASVFSMGFNGIQPQEYTRYFATHGRSLEDFDGSVEKGAGSLGGKGVFYATAAVNQGTSQVVDAEHFFIISASATGAVLEDIGQSLVNQGLQITSAEMQKEGGPSTNIFPLIVHGAPVYITDTIVENIAVSSNELSSWGLKFSQPICGCEYARALGTRKEIPGAATSEISETGDVPGSGEVVSP